MSATPRKLVTFFDSIRSVWLEGQQHRKNWLLRITFLTVLAVCGLDANNIEKTGYLG